MSQNNLVEFRDLQPGQLFTIGNSDIVYAKKSDGEYIVVQSQHYKVGDLIVGNEGKVRQLWLTPHRPL